MASYVPLGDLYANQRLGSFEGLGDFGALSRAETSQIQNPARQCPELQSLAAQAVNQINRGQLSTARGTAANIAARGAQIARQPGRAVCGGAGTIIQSQIINLAAREQSKAGGSPAAAGATAAPADDGVSAQAVGNVLTGIGAILAPLSKAGVGIFAASQQASLQKAQLKFQAQQAGRQPAFQQPMYMPPAPSSKAPILLAAVGGMVMLGVLVFALTR